MAIKFLLNRSFWLAIGFAVIFVFVSYLFNTHALGRLSPSLKMLELILTAFEIPALISGVLISNLQGYRGVEYPNPIAFYVTLFVTYIVIFGGVIKLVGFINKRVQKKRRT
jgi:hypothetical protein